MSRRIELYLWHDPERGSRTLAVHAKGHKFWHGWVFDCPYVRNVRLPASLEYPSARRPGTKVPHRLRPLEFEGKPYPVERWANHMRRLHRLGWYLPAALKRRVELED